MTIRTLDLHALARELDDLNERVEDGETLDEDDMERRAALLELESTIGNLTTSRDESQAIADDSKRAYAQSYAEETGMDVSAWPYTCIDWEQAADELLTAWTCFDFDGETWHLRE